METYLNGIAHVGITRVANVLLDDFILFRGGAEDSAVGARTAAAVRTVRIDDSVSLHGGGVRPSLDASMIRAHGRSARTR